MSSGEAGITIFLVFNLLDPDRGNYIFINKLPWPGDKKVIFRSSSHAAILPTCLPHTVEALHHPFDY